MRYLLLSVAMAACLLTGSVYAQSFGGTIRWTPASKELSQAASKYYKAFANVPVIAAPKIKTTENPIYPFEAARSKASGSVRVLALIDGQGRVTKMAIIEAHPKNVFEEATLAAISRWKFAKVKLNGEATEYIVDYIFDYSAAR